MIEHVGAAPSPTMESLSWSSERHLRLHLVRIRDEWRCLDAQHRGQALNGLVDHGKLGSLASSFLRIGELVLRLEVDLGPRVPLDVDLALRV